MPLEGLSGDEAIVAEAAVAVAIALATIFWIRRRSEPAPDPWPLDIDLAVRDPSAISLCVNCMYPQEERRWFCPYCGFPVGECVASMPYLYIFVLGESLRRGVTGPPERNALQTAFLAVFAAGQYAVFAPLYWYWMVCKAEGKPICSTWRREPNFEDEA
jgi:hypothetical protein